MAKKKKIAVYLTDYTNKSKIELPVNPSEITLEYETDDQQSSIVNLGEINRPGNVKLTSLTIDSVFPKYRMHYVSSKKLWKPETYVKKLKNIEKKKHHVQLVVSGTKISLTMTIQDFKYGFKDGFDLEYAYTLKLMQYRSFGYKKVKSPKKHGKKGKSKKRVSPPKKINVGTKVKVSGRLHADSYGRGAGMYEKNATRTILYVCPGRKYPVCIGVNGKPRGWVKRSDVRKA